MPLCFTKFICRNINENDNDDSKCLRPLVSDLIQLKAGPNQMPANLTAQQQLEWKEKFKIKADDTWEKKSVWVYNCMEETYEAGYVTRNRNVFGNHLATMVFLLGHGFYWLPKRNFTETLMQFLQEQVLVE